MTVRSSHDDEIRAWNNGVLFCLLNGSSNAEQPYDAVLYPGVNSVTIKLREGTGGDYMGIRVTDRLGNTFDDLKYAFDTRMLFTDAGATNITQTTATLAATLANDSGADCDVIAALAPAGLAGGLGTDIGAWAAQGAVFTLSGTAGGRVSIPVSDLDETTAYVARLFATNALTSAASDAFTFTTFSAAPALKAHGADPIAGTTATARGELLYAGADPEAEVWLCWGTTDGFVTGVWDNPPELVGTQGVGSISFELEGLDYNTAYLYRFFATNSVRGAFSNPVSFTTLGAPVLGAPFASVFSDFARLGIELESAGVSAATVSCWMAPASGPLAQVWEWSPETNPRTFAWTSGALVPGEEYAYAFKAVNQLPPPLGDAVAWSVTNTFIVGNRTLVWDNAAGNGVWNTASGNWHEQGLANGSAAFHNGDAAAFNAAATLTLAGDIDADRITAAAALTLNGAGTLSVYDTMELRGGGQILTPKISGPGGIDIFAGTFTLGNAGNDFTGAATVRQGMLSAQVPGVPGATPFGLGEIRLGAASNATTYAEFKLTSADSDVAVGGITATGGYNDARISFANSTLRAASIDRESGGAGMVLVAPNRAAYEGENDAQKFFLDNPPAGVFPPWFVISNNYGEYAEYDPVLGVRRAVIPNNSFVSGDPIVYPSGNTALSGAASANAVIFRNNTIDLAGNTLTIGDPTSDGGLLFRGGGTITDTVGGGAIVIGGESLMSYNDGDANYRADFAPGGVFRKFGENYCYMHCAVLPSAINVQGGHLTINRGAGTNTVYEGAVSGAGIMYTDGAGTLSAVGTELFDIRELNQYNGALVFDERQARIGTFRISQRAAQPGHLTLLNGATVTVPNYFAWGGKPAPSFITLEAGTLLDTYGNCEFGYATPIGNTGIVQSATSAHGGVWNFNGRQFQIGSAFTSNSRDNQIIIDNVTLTNVWFGHGDSGGKRNTGVILKNNARVWSTGVRLADKLGYDTYFLVTEGSEANFSGVIHVTMNNGDNNIIQVDGPGSIIRQSAGEFNVNYNLDGTVNYDNTFLVSNGGKYLRTAGSSNIRHAFGNSGTVMQRNKLHVTDPGSVFDANSLLNLEFANGNNSQGCTNNWIIVENHGVMTNLNNGFVATTAGKLSCDNTIRLASDGVMHLNGNLTIGNEVNSGNGIIFAGGVLLANNLTITSNNVIAVELTSDGIRESHLRGKAVFNPGAVLRLSADKDAPNDRFDLLTADDEEGIVGFDELVVVADPPHERQRWRHGLDNANKTLYIRRTADTTMLIIR
ncbi:MAG: hypothetical protein FWG05_02715 [Kiritimatiellaeota bacterium]|nr:hypothetical protein [Kiritimatiellota bacterium]